MNDLPGDEIENLVEQSPQQSWEEKIKSMIGKPVAVQWNDISYNDHLTPEDLDDPDFLANLINNKIITSYGRLIGIVNGHLIISQDHASIKESEDCSVLIFPLNPIMAIKELMEKCPSK